MLSLKCSCSDRAARRADQTADVLSRAVATPAMLPRLKRFLTRCQRIRRSHPPGAASLTRTQRQRPGAPPAPPEEATPGFTPTDEPPPPRAAPWLTVGPPQVAPGSRHSWLYIPLLHAAAGRLSDAAASAWRELPRFGDRWATLVDCLCNSAPASPHTLARLIRAIAELDAQEAAAGSTAADDAAAASLGSLPEAPLPLSAALLLCAQPDGYIPAASQAALLETYGGIPCAEPLPPTSKRRSTVTMPSPCQHAPRGHRMVRSPARTRAAAVATEATAAGADGGAHALYKARRHHHKRPRTKLCPKSRGAERAPTMQLEPPTLLRRRGPYRGPPLILSRRRSGRR